MQPNILTKKFRLAGFEERIDTAADFSEIITSVRDCVKRRAHQIPSAVRPIRLIGIWLPDPGELQAEMSSKRIYFSGIEVTSLEGVPRDWNVKELPASLFAQFREKSRGTMSRYAYAQWLPASGYLLNMDVLPGDFEIFDDLEHDGEQDECDILIPIRTPDPLGP